MIMLVRYDVRQVRIGQTRLKLYDKCQERGNKAEVMRSRAGYLLFTSFRPDSAPPLYTNPSR